MRRFMDRITEVMKRYRYRTAFTDGKETLTYLELENESAKIYRFLKNHLIGKEQFVTIHLPRNIHFFSCMLGVWKAGAAYVMMEKGYPEDRVKFIKEDCRSILTLDEELVTQILATTKPLFGYEETDVHDAAYAVYTSGSTGHPKGVLHEYGNIDQCALVTPEKDEYPECMFAYSAALNFVAAQLYLIDATLSAKTVFLVSQELSRNYDQLQETLEEQRIESIFFPPSFLRHYTEPTSYLKKIYTGSAPANDIYFPDGPVVEHNYAMSETGFFLFQYQLDKAYDVAPLGKPTLDLGVCLLKEDGTVVEGADEQGELCFVNDYIRGYINLPEQTEKAFRPSPADAAVRLFHTGDMAYRDAEGRYYIAGRIDDMMKIDGNRIEPAEIEAAIMKLTGLQEVLVRGFDDKSRAFVAAYFIGKEATEKGLWDGKTFKIDMEALADRLPYFMLPTYFISVEAFPKNANGKFVRKQLPAPDITKYFADYVAPETELQKKLCQKFEEILALTQVGIHDDFYVLGGDSLATIRLVRLLELPALSAMDIFLGRTPEKIAKIIEGSDVKVSRSMVEREKEVREKAFPLTAFQLNMFDYQLCAPESCMWNIPMLFTLSREDIDEDRFLSSVRKMVDNHPVFRTIVFFDEEGRVVQRCDSSLEIKIEMEKLTEAEFAEKRLKLNRPVRMIRNPLTSVRLFETETHVYMFLLSHHIIIDATGINVMLKSLWDCYEGKEPKQDTWYSYLDEESRKATKQQYLKAEQYFKREYGGAEWCNNLKPDNKSDKLNLNSFVIETELTEEKLKKIKQQTKLSANELCAAISLLAMAETEGEENVMLHWVFQNRITQESENAAGLVLRLLPVGATIKKDCDLEKVLDQISIHIREGIANSSNDWCLDNESVFQNDALFLVYEGSIMEMEYMKEHDAVTEILPNPDDTTVRRTALQVLASEKGLIFRFIYIDALFAGDHVEAFKHSLEKWIEQFADC